MSIRLESALGTLPKDWPSTPIRELATPQPTPRRRPRVDTGVALRAIAITLVVGTHAGLFNLSGGAHLLFGLAGFNFARFHLTDRPQRDRLTHLGRSLTRIVVPSVVWIVGAWLLTRQYGPANALLLHSLLRPDGVRGGWEFWFLESLVYLLVVIGALLSVRRFDRWERRWPYTVPLLIAGLGLLTRYDVMGLGLREHAPSVVSIFWLFALGWAAAKATRHAQRALVTAAVVVTVPGFFHDPRRELVIIVGMVVLTWVPSLPSPRVLTRVFAVLAGGSLFIYVTHWQVYPHLDHHHAGAAVAASLAVGLAYAAIVAKATSWLPRLRRFTSARPQTLTK